MPSMGVRFVTVGWVVRILIVNVAGPLSRLSHRPAARTGGGCGETTRYW